MNIPTDIENAAVSAMRHMDLGDTAYGYNGLRIRKAVASAILAERQRCIAAGFIIMSKKDVAEVRKQAFEEAQKSVCSGCSDEVPLNAEGYHQKGFHTFPCHVAAIRELKSQQNTETSAIEKKKFYHNEWPHDALMAARRDGFIDHNGGEAWRYQFTHKDEKGKYDLLYRDTSNSSIQAALPPVQTGGGE